MSEKRCVQLSWQLPTLPTLLWVPSAQPHFTSGFGMGPGSSTAPSHHYNYLHQSYFLFISFIEEANDVRPSSLYCRAGRNWTLDRRIWKPLLYQTELQPCNRYSLKEQVPQWNLQTFRIVIFCFDFRCNSDFLWQEYLRSWASALLPNFLAAKNLKDAKIRTKSKGVIIEQQAQNAMLLLIFLWTPTIPPEVYRAAKIRADIINYIIADFLGSQ